MVKEFCILMKNVNHIMMVTGNGERDMDWVFINTNLEISMRDNGQIILEMEKVKLKPWNLYVYIVFLPSNNDTWMCSCTVFCLLGRK